MAGSVNRVMLIGNLGKDPEIRSFQNGGRVASFSIATSETWRDKSTGEKRDRTEWHRISVLNDALVGIVEKWLRKGMKVYIEGQLETRKWTDKDGVEKFSTEVVLRPYRGDITMLESAKNGDSRHQQSQHEPSLHSAPASDDVPMLDDEIPF